MYSNTKSKFKTLLCKFGQETVWSNAMFCMSRRLSHLSPKMFLTDPLWLPQLCQQFLFIIVLTHPPSSFASPHLDFPILLISRHSNSNSNSFASPHLDLPILLISRPSKSNSNSFASFSYPPFHSNSIFSSHPVF